MRHRPRYEILLVIGILIVASFFRFYKLNSFPPGLYPDEAMGGVNGLIANSTHHYQLFYPENNGRQGLYINLQALSVKLSGIHAWALRDVSGIIGVLTVLGLYLLASELFDWQIGAISSFLLAISFWHVNFSRIGFDGIMVPFILVYLFYFLWRGLRRNKYIDFFWAGLFTGIGFYTYSAYRPAPLIILAVFFSYWLFVKKDFSHPTYEHTRNRLLGGFCVLAITAFFVALPMGMYFMQNPSEFNGRTGQVAVFSQPHPWQSLAQSTVLTLNMFIARGDGNPRHNIPTEPEIAWPIAIFLAMGFLKELHHWLERKHGHFSPVHTLLFTWFIVMLLPGFLSTEAPHALRTIGVLPIIMIFAARGLWWVFHAAEEWEIIQHPWEGRGHNQYIAPLLALLAVLGAFAFYEYHRYFDVFGPSQITASAFNQGYVDTANKINALPNSTKKYVLVTAPGVLVNGLPVATATVMFLTDTPDAATQHAKNLVYISEDKISGYRFDPKGVIFRIQ